MMTASPRSGWRKVVATAVLVCGVVEPTPAAELITHGATDEIGFAAVENRVSGADWHATILHWLGLYHEELFFERSGFAEKLTSTFAPRVVEELLT